MRKTSVYLSEDEADALRRAASATGMTQSTIIRDGISRVVAAHGARGRTFHSMGRGRGGADAPRRWTSDELDAKTHGRR